MGVKDSSNAYLKQTHQEQTMSLEESLFAETKPHTLLSRFIGKILHHFNISNIRNNQHYCHQNEALDSQITNHTH